MNYCLNCNRHFWGDANATRCEECANKTTQPPSTPAVPTVEEVELRVLRYWKESAIILLNKISEYAEKHPDIRLGESMVDFVINRARKYDQVAASTTQGAVSADLETVFVPCERDHGDAIGTYASFDGQRVAYVRESKVPVVKEGPVWIRANEFNIEYRSDHNASDAVEIMLWAFTNIQAWDKENDTVTLLDGTKCTIEQLYQVFKSK